MITDLDIIHMEEVIKNTAFPKKDSIWIRAFKEYNENKRRPSGMGCRSCYYDVLRHHKQLLND